ncbi:MAG: redoxin domain-containing protein [Candidatus Dormibacteraeota bacterium]|nr:redoxin domain-containing protein [Candidatus Dormibacteraeota bacterium]
MTRFRIALGAVVVAIAVVVVITVTHAPMPPTTTGSATSQLLPVNERQPAPDFTGIDAWINSPPLSVSKLQGHVVLVDFWTFSCVNCVRTIPHLQQLDDAYRSHGFVIVGVHSPEFDFEKVTSNVRAAAQRLGVTWPVAVDSEMATWNAYSNQYWPAEYLIDQQGRIAYVNFGEGNYDATDSAVASLLGIRPGALPSATAVPGNITPELYAGSERGQLSGGEQYGNPGQPASYPDPGPPSDANAIQVTGTWIDEGQYLVSDGPGHVRLNFQADSVYVVVGTQGGSVPVSVSLDGRQVAPPMSGPALTSSKFTVAREDLYHLLINVSPGSHLIDLTVPSGLQLYTFTFG